MVTGDAVSAELIYPRSCRSCQLTTNHVRLRGLRIPSHPKRGSCPATETGKPRPRSTVISAGISATEEAEMACIARICRIIGQALASGAECVRRSGSALLQAFPQPHNAPLTVCWRTRTVLCSPTVVCANSFRLSWLAS
nr:hypothetical protein CFP56_20370 [Quercus suber]